MIGSNQVNVSAWELGTRTPNLATIKHIAEVFKVPLSSLISIRDTGMDEDLVNEVAEAMHKNPKMKMLFDKARRMSCKDLDVILTVADAISGERDDND